MQRIHDLALGQDGGQDGGGGPVTGARWRLEEPLLQGELGEVADATAVAAEDGCHFDVFITSRGEVPSS